MVKLFYILRNELAGTFHQTKNLLILFFIVVVYEETYTPMAQLLAQTGMEAGFYEPFILMIHNRLNIIAIPLIFVSIVSAFPHCRLDYFGMIRLNKRRWLAGEILFVTVVSFIVVCILFIASCIFFMKLPDAGAHWGTFMEHFPHEFRELYEQNQTLILGAEVLTQGAPIKVFAYCALAMWMYLIVMGLIMIAGAACGKRLAGLAVDILLTLAGGAALYANGMVCWSLPLYHLMYGNHFNLFFAKVKLPVWCSFAYLGALIAALTVFCALKLKKMEVGEAS